MEQYKLVVFDWDGTLIDSIGRIVSSMQMAAKLCHFDVPSESEVKKIIGLSLPIAMQQLFPHRSEAQEVELVKQYKHQYITLNSTPSPLFARTVELLQLLKQQNRHIAVATGKARDGLNRVWQETQIGHLFDSSVCADEAKSKPDPTMLNMLLAEFNVLPEHVLMVGDSRHDLAMAKNANIDSIGITLGADNKQELAKHSPKKIVHSVAELEQLFVTG